MVWGWGLRKHKEAFLGRFAVLYGNRGLDGMGVLCTCPSPLKITAFHDLAGVAQGIECQPANRKVTLVQVPVRAHAWVVGPGP